MKKLAGILSVSFLLLSSAATLKAAQDTTEINLDVTFVEYVNFIGSAVGSSNFFTVDDIKPVGTRRRGPRVDLGRLGLESNSAGDCDIDISTANNFRLRHTVTNQRLTRYRLRWKNRNITRNRNRQFTLPCNTNATRFRFQAVGNFRNNPQAGIYQDIVTVTVTTQ